MSAQATFWAWSLELPANAKYVLLCLCNCHNGSTGDCFPSIPYIAKMTRLNHKTVSHWLHWLEANGYCQTARRQGLPSHYQLNISEHEPPPKLGAPNSGGTPPPNLEVDPPQNRGGNLKGNLKVNKTPAKRANRKTSIPPDFAISDGVRAWAEKNGHTNLEARLEHFRDACEAKNYQYVNWDAAFKTAIRQDWARISGGSPYFGAGPEEYL